MNLALYFMLICFWGGSYVAIKFALLSFPVSTSVLLRVGIGLAFMLLVAFGFRKPLSLKREVWMPVWITGLLAQAIPFLFLFFAETHVSAAMAGILAGATPIFTTTLGAIFLPSLEPISRLKVVGLTMGVLGLTVIFYPSLSFQNNLYEFLGLCSLLVMALCYAISSLLGRYLSQVKKVDLVTSVVHHHLASFVLLLILCLAKNEMHLSRFTEATSVSWWALVYLGIPSTGIGWLIFFRLASVWGASRASTVTYVVPLVTIALDYLTFDSFPNSWQLSGAGVVLGGVILVQIAKSNLKAVPLQNVDVSKGCFSK